MKNKAKIATLAAIASLGGCAQYQAQTITAEVARQMSASMLSQAQWKDLAGRLEGQVGPDSIIEVEGYVKQSTGARVNVHGSSLSVGMEGKGTGGNVNELALYDKLKAAGYQPSVIQQIIDIVRQVAAGQTTTTQPAPTPAGE